MSNTELVRKMCFRLPEVKKFLFDDLESKYENTVFKKVPGKAPTMKLYDDVRNF